MRTYIFKLSAHIAGLIILSVALAYGIAAGMLFCVVVPVLLIICIAISLYMTQMKQLKSWKYLVNCIRQNDLTQTIRPPFSDSEMTELADELSAALRKLSDKFTTQEMKRHFYENLLSKTENAMIVCNSNGKIEWRNKASVNITGNKPFVPGNILSAINNNEKVIRMDNGSHPIELSVETSRIFIKGMEHRIVCLKNIHHALERKEMEAWQKLIRVLTHEIMNSITPIISLSETLGERCDTAESMRDTATVRHGIEVIHRRSKGLLDFVENYRRLTRIAPPVKNKIPVKEFFSDLKKLFPRPFISFSLGNGGLCFYADRPQMEQVFINLIKNAIEACASKENPAIAISAQMEQDKIIFTVSDNGEGILPEVMERIFIPFFTTRRSGSGIGLSLCRQIITMHGGSIYATSKDGEGSTFVVEAESV
ncbi:MAG: HAMP domain-containing sensor histidine kinase [Parabacteroides sp.]|nr:HAMP domain-containing sensor histidine kinase [Parabacteroides sp.]